MNKIECIVGDIPQEIMWSDLFEFRLVDTISLKEIEE